MTDKPAARVVILTNGHLPDPERARRHIRAGDRLVCADAGARYAIAMGLVPDVVVGDMDSLSPEQRVVLAEAGVRFEVYPVLKDKTDLELALRLAVTEGATEIDLLATQGGRLDQSLANLLLLARPEWASLRVRVIEGHQTAWVMRGGQTAQVPGTAGDVLSLVPLAAEVTGVNLSGVRWPLHDATLYLGDTLSISNALVGPVAGVEVGEGLVLVVHQAAGQSS
jgi:thiamine pyrophosphokinase